MEKKTRKGHTSNVEEDIFKGEEWVKMGSYFLRKWKTLTQEAVDKFTGPEKLPLHVFFYEALKKDAVREMEKILDFVEKEKCFQVPDRARRLRCLQQVNCFSFEYSHIFLVDRRD